MLLKIYPMISRETLPLLNNNKFNENCKGVKGIITGPSTLVLSCRIEGFYKRDKKERIIGDMALALKKEAHDLERAGAVMIQDR